MRILIVFILMGLCQTASAKIGIELSLIYKKGIGSGFFLSTEQHSIQSVFEKEAVTIEMSNGIKTTISAQFVQSVHEYGPSGFVRIKGKLFGVNGKVVKDFNDPGLDIYLGHTKTITHQDGEEEQIEILITPVSL